MRIPTLPTNSALIPSPGISALEVPAKSSGDQPKVERIIRSSPMPHSRSDASTHSLGETTKSDSERTSSSRRWAASVIPCVGGIPRRLYSASRTRRAVPWWVLIISRITIAPAALSSRWSWVDAPGHSHTTAPGPSRRNRPKQIFFVPPLSPGDYRRSPRNERRRKLR